MTDKESAKNPTALPDPAGARTHDPSTTDKRSSALPTPLLGPAETNTHIGFLSCIHLISEWILYSNLMVWLVQVIYKVKYHGPSLTIYFLPVWCTCSLVSRRSNIIKVMYIMTVS